MSLFFLTKGFDKSINLKNILGLKFFQIGILFLASVPFLSFLLFTIASILGSINREDKYLQDSINRIFIIVSVLMIINCLLISIKSGESINNLHPSLAWIGLLNWLPFFWIFWSFQTYLKNNLLRIQAARLFIIGSLPVLFSGFTQYFLKWYGPYELFNRLIIWYQRPLGDDNGVTGLFNNYNYCGAWLSIVLPLIIGFLIKEKKNKVLKLFFLIIIFFFIYMIILTTSRNALVSIVLALILLTPIKKFKFEIISLFFFTGIVFTNLIPFFSFNIQDSIFKFIPSSLLDKTSLASLSRINSFPRVEIWTKSLKLIKANLFTGYGGGSFSDLYNLSDGKFEGIQHSHNIFLEIAFSSGLPVSILISATMIFILYQNSKIFILNKSKDLLKKDDEFFHINKAWIISFLIFFFLHMFDITYFDGRISILAWILLAGMRQIIKEYRI